MGAGLVSGAQRQRRAEWRGEHVRGPGAHGRDRRSIRLVVQRNRGTDVGADRRRGRRPDERLGCSTFNAPATAGTYYLWMLAQGSAGSTIGALVTSAITVS